MPGVALNGFYAEEQVEPQGGKNGIEAVQSMVQPKVLKQIYLRTIGGDRSLLIHIALEPRSTVSEVLDACDLADSCLVTLNNEWLRSEEQLWKHVAYGETVLAMRVHGLPV